MTHLIGIHIADVRIKNAWSMRKAARKLYPLKGDGKKSQLRMRRKWFRARLAAPREMKPIYTVTSECAAK